MRLTAKQHRTYLFIRHYLLKFGMSPTQAEIAKGIGIKSCGVVQRYLNALVTAGLIIRHPKSKRNIELVTDATLPYSNLPIIGKVAAGNPIESIEDERVLDLAESLMGPHRFVLEVKGDSMSGDHICDGDYIICEQRTRFDDGDIVVALIDENEATLKRLKHNQDGTITLLPSNPTVSPMMYQPDQVKFKGVYLGLIRLRDLTSAVK